MKVLINVTYYYPHWTGLTQYAKTLAEGLATRGHEVTVLTTRFKQSLRREELINNVKVIRGEPTVKISRSMISAEVLFKLPGFIKQNDVIIGFLPLNEALLLSLLGKMMGKKVFLVHNGDLILPKNTKGEIIEKIFYISTGAAVNLATNTVAYTNDYAVNSKLLRNKPGRYVCILPPVDQLTSNSKDRQRIRKILPKGTKRVVGFAGRFVEEKGFDILLEAVPIVVEKIPGTKFLFAGEIKIDYENFWSRNRKQIRKNINNIIWLGLLNRQQMGAFYESCDLFVLSSRSECFGLVQAEAMMSGVPVVVTNVPGARWLVKNTGAGIVCSPENPKALAEAITEGLKNNNKYRKYTHKSKKLFDRDIFLDKYEKLFENG